MSRWRTPESGQVIAERYRLVEPLGRGGMGEVWRAEHLALRAPVAAKLIDAELLAHVDGAGLEEILARFEREAQAAALLRSPHVVQVMDHGVEDGVAYLVMELLEGETLEDRLQVRRPLAHDETLRILTHVARAMDKAHKLGIVHRDLKPDNVFLVRNDDEEIAKVLDFGVAKLTNPVPGQTRTTRTGRLLGTPCYMSPEQAEGRDEIDARTDLWAMAVITFECICGYRPFESEAIGDLVLQICAKPLPIPSTLSDVPPGFDAWWARAANRDPRRRFSTAKELVGALRPILGGAPELPVSDPGFVDEPTVALPDRPERAMPVRSADLAPTAVMGTQPGLVTSHAQETRPPRRTPWLVAGLAILTIAALSFVIGPRLQSDDTQAQEEPPPTAPRAAASPSPTTAEPAASEASASAPASASASASTSAPVRAPAFRPRPAWPRPRPTPTPSRDRLGI
jgi:serine/threonine-protein kinase